MRANKAAPKILFVPAFAALLNLDADAVGFTRPTWSLMSNVENRFAAHVAGPGGHVRRALGRPAPGRDPAGRIRPSRRPPAGGCSGRPATSATSRSWTRWRPWPSTGRTSGSRMARFLSSDLPLQGRYPTLGVGGRPRRRSHARSRRTIRRPRRAAWSRRSHYPPTGASAAMCTRTGRRWSSSRRRSIHAGRSTVDGHDAPTQMIAPGFVGVRVSAGRPPGPLRVSRVSLLLAAVRARRAPDGRAGGRRAPVPPADVVRRGGGHARTGLTPEPSIE